jgi:hypothetical protein
MEHLRDRAIIFVSGPEARDFLQGLITNDVEAVAPGEAIYAALLTPQGKILFDFLIADDGAGSLLLDCAAASRDAIIKRLSMYRLRAKLEITPRDDLAVFVSGDGSALPGLAFDDPRLAALGMRSIGPKSDAVSESNYLAKRLSLGVPEAADFGSDKIFALDAGLDELHGIAFDKGCYVGQELTARMKHRGTARKRLLVVESTDNSPIIANAELRAGDHAIGEITSTYGARGFALIRLDRLADASGAPVRMGETQVTVTKPAWLSA